MSKKSDSKFTALNRRTFLRGAALGCAVLAVRVIPLAQASEESDFSAGGAEFFRVQSGESQLAPWTHHFHFLDIPVSYFDNPPAEGVRVSTSWTLLHSHAVYLQQADLKAIASGELVIVGDNAGDHLYQIQLQTGR